MDGTASKQREPRVRRGSPRPQRVQGRRGGRRRRAPRLGARPWEGGGVPGILRAVGHLGHRRSWGAEEGWGWAPQGPGRSCGEQSEQVSGGAEAQQMA